MKKIKNGAKKPPLSLLDKTIYIILVLFGFAMLLVMMLVLGLFLPNSIAFADDTVIASTQPFLAACCVAPISMLVSLAVMIPSCNCMQNKQPIFGNKHFKPSGLKPVIKTYPLFSKEFRENLSNSTKQKIKKTVKILIILFIVFSLIYSLGIFPRTVLDKYNNFTSYNVFNNETHSCNITEAEKLVIDITYSSSRHHSSWGIRLQFICADKTHQFNLGSFYEMNTEETLNYMIYLKSLLSDRYEITNIDRMEKLIWDRGFSAQETGLVYELFDYKAS